MIQTNTNKHSLRSQREQEKKQKQDALRIACESVAVEKFGKEKIVSWSNQYKGLWYLPVLDEEENIETMLVLRPIDRHILSFASTKMADDGLYIFLETAMRDCTIASIEPGGAVVVGNQEPITIIDDDDYFLAAADRFNGILQSKKTALVKR